MRLGIVADIHEDIESLARALAELRRLGADQVVSLGDACDIFGPTSRAGEVVSLLRGAGAVGVWGNHDVGLCHEVPERIRQQAAPEVLQFMATMQPYLVVEGCRFSHVEPWLDARQVENLWSFDVPDTPEKAGLSFAAVPERLLFIGHFHQWLVMTPAGRLNWNREGPLKLDAESRHLIVVAPVLSGWCALFDTAERLLIPVRCGDS